MANLTTFKSDIRHFFVGECYNKNERKKYVENLINEQYDHIKDECNIYYEVKSTEGVHRTHCCVKHGCKYNQDEYCPVVNREIEQDYLCESCGTDGITLRSELHDVNTPYMLLSKFLSTHEEDFTSFMDDDFEKLLKLSENWNA